MHRSTRNLIISALLAVALGGLGATLPVPFVALGPGPTYNTLGKVGGIPVVAVDGLQTFPTSGNLNMTTVLVTDGLTLFTAVGYWAAADRRLVPREQVVPVGKTSEQVQQENTRQFSTSETDAEIAALTELELPVRIVVGQLTAGSPAQAA